MSFSRFLYSLFLHLYQAAISLVAVFNLKAKKWREGRKDWEKKWISQLQPGEKRIWIHCSSLGEFEQARPLIEALKENYPNYPIVLSFFSPSGYEIQKKYNKVDYVFYLPLDGEKTAESVLSLINPSLAIFVKYEFWYYYLNRLQQLQVPVILISAVFREGQPFFKWYGSLFREMLGSFRIIFVQDGDSMQLLKSYGFDKKAMISGDTRYDRVSKIAKSVESIAYIEQFKEGKRILIAGSTYSEDESILSHCLPLLPENWKMIIAPHEIDLPHLNRLGIQFSGSIRYSHLNQILPMDSSGSGPVDPFKSRVLIIDNIGMLSALYSLGDIALIGGGFQKGGIHNILEPAVFGLPIIFGPKFEKFVEARQLVSLGAAFPIHNTLEAETRIQELTKDEKLRMNIRDSMKKFVLENTGATELIMKKLKQENWLKS